MRSADDDLRAAAVIRDSAMRLFAERGVAAVTVRDVAASAGVSPALVIHHYRSKDGLKTAVDERAMAMFGQVFTAAAESPSSGEPGASLTAKFADVMGTNPLLPGYLRRLLIDNGPAADTLFRSLYDMTRATLARMQEAGLVRASADPDARAAFLLANDLATIVLREQITDVLGADPLSPQGLLRFGTVVMDVYTNGVLDAPPGHDGAASPEEP